MAALTKRVFVVMAAVFLCSAFCLPPAEAELVPIAITADVTDVRDDYDFLEGKVNIGDLITGVYIYDTSTPDSDPAGGDFGSYRHFAPPAGITLTAGGFVFITDPDNVKFSVLVYNNTHGPVGGGQYDKFTLRSENNLPLPNGVWVHIRLGLSDCSHSALSSAALPTTAPVLDDWEANYVYVGGGGGRKPFHIDGRLTSADLIPEPATFALLGIGALVLLRSRERSSRTK